MNKITDSQLERLIIVSEECAEVQQIISKIIRHGFNDYSPFDETKTTNRVNLEKEIGDLLATIEILERNDVDAISINANKNNKLLRINKWLHFNIV